MNDTKTMQEMSRVLAAMEDEPEKVQEETAIEEEEEEAFMATGAMGEGALPVDSDDYENEVEETVEPANEEESTTEDQEPSPPIDPPTEPPPPPPSSDVVEEEEESHAPGEEETATPNNTDTMTTPSSSSAETDVVLALMGWCNAWNSNNVEAYLDAYDPNATYISESLLRAKVTKDDIVLRGETAIRLLFRSIFHQTKGGETNLRYSQVQVELMGTRHASVFGRFTLMLTKGNRVADAGVFTLCVVKNSEGVWKILSEHSSSSLDPQKKKKKR